jgi:serine/threonine protein phosphatase PrpC
MKAVTDLHVIVQSRTSLDDAFTLTDDSLTRCERIHRPPMLSLPESSARIEQVPRALQPARNGRMHEESSCGIVHGVAARCGRRRIVREDMYSTLTFAVRDKETGPISIFGVYDGHGGHRAAQFASDRLPQLLLEDKRLGLCPKEALHQVFMQTDKEFLASSDRTLSFRSSGMGKKKKSGSRFAFVALQRMSSRGSSIGTGSGFANVLDSIAVGSVSVAGAPGMTSWSTSIPSTPSPQIIRSNSKAEDHVASVSAKVQNCGTTATIVTLVGMDMVCAHVGDSRAVLRRRGGEAFRVCDDHRPCRKDELERIESAGGLILSVDGTLRINGVLSVSRAIGDRELKEFVIAEPEVMTKRLTDQDEFLVVASDGMWDFIEDQECVDMTHKHLNYDKLTLENAALRLVMTACDRGSKDDVCVVIIDLCLYMGMLSAMDQGDSNGYISEPNEVVVGESEFELNMAHLDIVSPLSIPQTGRAAACRPAW